MRLPRDVPRPAGLLLRSSVLIAFGLALFFVPGCIFLVETDPEIEYVVVYEEEFVDPASYAGTNEWNTSDTVAAASWVADGALQILIREEEYYKLSRPAGVGTGDDFRLDVGLCMVAGPSQGEAGVIFRVQESWDCLRFSITMDGQMRLRKRVGGSWTELVNWTLCLPFDQGVDCNVITVIANGSHYDFYVNDIWVLEATDTTLHGGGIGVVAAAPSGATGTHAAFPIVILSEPI